MTSLGLAVPTPKAGTQARQRPSVLSAEPPPHCPSKPDPCRAITNLSTGPVCAADFICVQQLSVSLRHHRLLSTRHCYLHFLEKDTHPHEREDPPKPEGAGPAHRDTLDLRAAKAFCSLSCASFTQRTPAHAGDRARTQLNQNLVCNRALTSFSLTGDVVRLYLR